MKGPHVKLKVVLILSVLLIVLSGCNSNDFLRNAMNRMAPDDDEALAKECLAELLAGDFQAVVNQLDPQLVKPGIASELSKVASMLAPGDPLSRELVGCNVFSSSEKRRTNLTYQYRFTNAWVLAAVTIETMGEQKHVLGINVNPIPKSLGELNAFTLSGKGIQHYVLLVIAVIVPIFIGWALILCARITIRRKWLWILFILVGVVRLKLNWTTGQMGFQPIAIQLFGSGVAKMGLYAPWILTVTFPLGAILFLIKRRNLQTMDVRKTDSSETEAGRELSEFAPGKVLDEPPD